MRRIILLFTVAAMMAVMLMSMAAGPASALVIFDNKDHDNDHNKFFFDRDHRDFFNFDRDGLVSFELGDVNNESGDVELENNFEISGNNNNACLGQQQFANTGNFTNQQGVLQVGGGVFVDDDNNNDRDHDWNWWNRDRDHNRNFDRDRDNGFFFGNGNNNGDLEFEGPEITFAPQNETTCDQAVQQSSAASSWDDSSWGW